MNGGALPMVRPCTRREAPLNPEGVDSDGLSQNAGEFPAGPLGPGWGGSEDGHEEQEACGEEQDGQQEPADAAAEPAAGAGRLFGIGSGRNHAVRRTGAARGAVPRIQMTVPVSATIAVIPFRFGAADEVFVDTPR